MTLLALGALFTQIRPALPPTEEKPMNKERIRHYINETRDCIDEIEEAVVARDNEKTIDIDMVDWSRPEYSEIDRFFLQILEDNEDRVRDHLDKYLHKRTHKFARAYPADTGKELVRAAWIEQFNEIADFILCYDTTHIHRSKQRIDGRDRFTYRLQNRNHRGRGFIVDAILGLLAEEYSDQETLKRLHEATQ